MNIRDQLLAIREEYGSLTPALLVDVARDPGHPLHARFEWDDGAAAHRWRLEQASQLLRVTYRPIPGKPTELRAFSVQRGTETPTSEYVPTEDVLADPFARELLLRQMKRDAATFRVRYSHMAEYAAVIQSLTEGGAA